MSRVAPPESDPSAPLVAARAIHKRYGPVQALADVDLELHAGRVHALVGENGAGKSTLAKVLAGVVQPDSGVIAVAGRPAVLRERRAAIEAGIGLVPQQLSLVAELSLVENFLLGRPGWLANGDEALSALAAAAERSGIRLSLTVRTGALSLAERQLGEVLLALAEGARVLLLDEPTSSLGPVEVESLIEQVRALAEGGSAVVLVTHRLDEVLRAADEVTVLRAGHRVHHGPAGLLDPHSLAELMVGERPALAEKRSRQPSPASLRASHVNLRAETGPALKDMSLAVAAGEIVGVVGVAGNGQRALVEVLAGLVEPDSGTVELAGVPITGRPGRATKLGLAYIPEERGEGLIASQSVADNAALLKTDDPAFHRLGVRLRAAAVRFARRLCEQFDVRPPRPEVLAGALSGGNQQKLMVGRELERQPAAIVAHGPTQGLDIAAAGAIRSELLEAADRGAAVLVVSADLDEVLALADRIVVLAGGRLVDEQSGHAPDVARLGRAMAGLM